MCIIVDMHYVCCTPVLFISQAVGLLYMHAYAAEFLSASKRWHRLLSSLDSLRLISALLAAELCREIHSTKLGCIQFGCKQSNNTFLEFLDTRVVFYACVVCT